METKSIFSRIVIPAKPETLLEQLGGEICNLTFGNNFRFKLVAQPKHHSTSSSLSLVFPVCLERKNLTSEDILLDELQILGFVEEEIYFINVSGDFFHHVSFDPAEILVDVSTSIKKKAFDSSPFSVQIPEVGNNPVSYSEKSLHFEYSFIGTALSQLCKILATEEFPATMGSK